MTHQSTADDARYVDLLIVPLRACANTRPSLGRADGAGVTLPQFRALYGADPLYCWIGLDSDLMYAAHKAAGAMTSVTGNSDSGANSYSGRSWPTASG